MRFRYSRYRRQASGGEIVSATIYDDDGFPHMVVTHDGWDVFGATLQGVAPESREWLANHISEGFAREIEKAKARGYAKAQADMRKALGIS